MTRSLRLFIGAVGVAIVLPALAATAGAAAAGDAVRLLMERTTAEVDRTRVIAVAVETPPERDTTYETRVGDERVLEIVRGAAVLAGESVGYLRVRGRTAGETTITIGGAALVVRVVPAPAGGLGLDDRPRITGPATGAVVWGTITVGVEVREDSDGPPRRIALALPDGTLLEPEADTGRAQPPYRQLAFAVDTTTHGAGPLALAAVTLDDDGPPRRGDVVRVRVIDPDPASLFAAEAEQRCDVDRPQRFRDARLNIGRDRRASGGKFFSNAGAYPAQCFPLRVETPGRYQVMLVASGTRAKGALPTVGIVVDGANEATTNARLLVEGWHRFAAGVPFALEPGDHVITPYFANDFYAAGLADRNLRLDRVEIARVADDDSDGGGGSAGMMAAMTGGAMMDMAGAAGGAALSDDPMALRAVPLRIAFVTPLDGRTIPGLIEIEGRAWWQGLEARPAPLVTLFVNHTPIMTQRSGAPRFWVDPSCFVAGANEIRLEAALDSGAVARTPVQTMHWPEEAAGPGASPPRRHHRFSIHEERWDPAIHDLLGNRHYPKERRAAIFQSESALGLALPADVAGPHDVFLELRGEAFEGLARASVTLEHGDETVAVGTIDAPGWWDTRRVETVDLPAGEKRLVVRFENDHYVKGRGDRNLLLQSLMLVEKPKADDETAPVVEIAYPADGHRAHETDALVAACSDNASLASAELVLDGMHTGVTLNLNLKPGRVVFPLLLRTLEPGPHTVGVRAIDVAGNSTESEPVAIVVTATAEDADDTYRRAVRLLDRFAYGPDPRELAALLTMGEEAWLADRLDRPIGDDGDLAALHAGLPYFANRSQYEVPHRAISHVLLTPNPLRARFTLWAENHFSTWIRKTNGDRKWTEHVAFSRLGPARFDALLFASAESPAMLGYLDQEASYAGAINENFAREVMELHTLGVDGGYTQRDVTRLAALLTGWTVSVEGDGVGGGQGARRYTFRFDPRLNDGGATSVLGMAFPAAAVAERYDRVRLAIELLAAHPSTARYVSRKLAEHYVAVPAPDALVDDLAAVFLETGGDMRALLTAIAAHPDFWTADDRIAAPLDYAARLCRTAGHYQPWQVGQFLQRSGAGLFDRASPDGYPEDDAAYTDSNALLQRWRLSREFAWQLAGHVPGVWRYQNTVPEARWAQHVVDVVAVRITGHVLDASSNRAALDLLAGATGSRDERVRLVAPFIASLPEANLR